MTNTTPRLRFPTVAALLTSAILMVGCGSPDKVTRTTTTEQTTTNTPPPGRSIVHDHHDDTANPALTRRWHDA